MKYNQRERKNSIQNSSKVFLLRCTHTRIQYVILQNTLLLKYPRIALFAVIGKCMLQVELSQPAILLY